MSDNKVLIDLGYLLNKSKHAAGAKMMAKVKRPDHPHMNIGTLVTSLNSIFNLLESYFPRLEIDVKPKDVALCLDKKPYFRSFKFPKYKEGRPREEDKIKQLDFLHNAYMLRGICEFMGIGSLVSKPIQHAGKTWFGEADDVIYTASNKFVSNKTVYIYGNDLDLTQALRPGVKMIRPVTGGLRMIDYTNIMDLKRLSTVSKPKWDARTGNEILLYKGVIGDSSDGYNGVHGVGDGKWLEILGRFRDLNRPLEDYVKEPQLFGELFNEKQREKAVDGHESFKLCLSLARLRTVPIAFDRVDSIPQVDLKTPLKLQGATKRDIFNLLKSYQANKLALRLEAFLMSQGG